MRVQYNNQEAVARITERKLTCHSNSYPVAGTPLPVILGWIPGEQMGRSGRIVLCRLGSLMDAHSEDGPVHRSPAGGRGWSGESHAALGKLSPQWVDFIVFGNTTTLHYRDWRETQ